MRNTKQLTTIQNAKVWDAVKTRAAQIFDEIDPSLWGLTEVVIDLPHTITLVVHADKVRVEFTVSKHDDSGATVNIFVDNA